MFTFRRSAAALLLGALLHTSLPAADEPAPDYASQIAPLLTKYCAGCHNDDDRDGDFSLESFASLQKGTPDGPALLPGDAAGSKMLRLLTGAAEPTMPPEDEPRPSDEEIALLTAWIEAGAPGPDGAEPDRTVLIVPHIESKTDTRPVAALDWSDDGGMLAVARYAEVDLHTPESIASGEPVRVLTGFPGKVNAVHFTKDGRLVTASGVAGRVGRAQIWNLAEANDVRTFTGHRDILYDAELSPDGTILATCGYDREIILWDVETGTQLRTLTGHNGAVYDIAFSPDGAVLASASADDTCKVWGVADGARLDTLGQPLKEQYAVTFSPDGKYIVAGGADNRIRVWEFISRTKPRINPLLHARFAHEGPIVQLAFTKGGKQLVSLAEDRTLKLWETDGYTAIRDYPPQPAVAMALAVNAAGSLAIGRMDGSLAVYDTSAADAAATTDQTATVAAHPPSVSGAMTEVQEQEPNDLPAQAATLTAPATVTGVIHDASGEKVDADTFRFAAQAGDEWVIEVNAARSDSGLDSFIEVLDANGERIERVVLQALRDSYFTFRGKDANTVDDFRVFNWEEMDLNEYLYANGEVVKLWLYPRGPDSGFMVYPGQGSRWGFFDTTPLSHALGEPCYIVRPYAPGSEILPNGLPTFTLYYENDDESRRGLKTDSQLYFTAPADGEYLVRLRDVRGDQGENFSYKLTIRPRKPDFKVTLHGANPNVGAGSGKEFRVEVQRMDRFDGPIRVDIAGVPPGFHVATPLVIEEGQLEAFGVITADPDAKAPEGAEPPKVTATAMVQDAEVTREVNSLGEIKLAEAPKLRVRIEPAEGGAQPIGISEDGLPEYVIRPGETIMLKVVLQRDEFDGNVAFGKEGSGRNLPFGSFIANLGLNGLLILEGQQERNFFVYAAPWVPDTTRTFHLNTGVEGGQASPAVVLHVRRDENLAGE